MRGLQISSSGYDACVFVCVFTDVKYTGKGKELWIVLKICLLKLMVRQLDISCHPCILCFYCNYFLLSLAADRLDVNITSSLITMIQNTLKNWSEDYYGPAFLDSTPSKRGPGLTVDDAPSESTSAEAVAAGPVRKRAPFVPFILRNETGRWTSNFFCWCFVQDFPRWFRLGSTLLSRKVRDAVKTRDTIRANLVRFRILEIQARRLFGFVGFRSAWYLFNLLFEIHGSVFFLNFVSGCTLHFATVTSSPSKVVMTATGLVFSGRVRNSSMSESSKKLSEWRQVLPGDEAPFEFKQSREKQRHKVRVVNAMACYCIAFYPPPKKKGC